MSTPQSTLYIDTNEPPSDPPLAQSTRVLPTRVLAPSITKLLETVGISPLKDSEVFFLRVPFCGRF